MPDLLARVHVSLADIDGRPSFPEAEDLVSVGSDCNGRRARLTADAGPAWLRMRDAAGAAGIGLLLVSAFRSYDHQVRLWERKLAAGQTPAEIRRVVAVPGFSQHHTGRAVDVGTPGCTDLTEQFETTPAFAWLTAHAGAFGFFMPYGRENSLGVVYEPWHWCWFEGTTMKLEYRMERADDHLHVVVTGNWVMAQFRPLVEAIRDECQRSGSSRVLVNALAIPENLAAADRFDAGKLVATLLVGVKIALVFDPARTTKLAENTAVNRGATLAIFGERATALAWLLRDAPPVSG